MISNNLIHSMYLGIVKEEDVAHGKREFELLARERA